MSYRNEFYINDQFATNYLTLTVVGWIGIFTRRELSDVVINSLSYCQDNKGLIINAYVLISSHIHIVSSAREESDGLSSIVRNFKKVTSKEIIRFVLNNKEESRRDWLELVFKSPTKYKNSNKIFSVCQDANQPKDLIHPKFIAQ